ncbi:hypothetical protein [Xanthomonas oryzae]|uniref:hypothetical protein n=1 Tax=Xanthomonas oryzae TaxID=347 RepID=UPI0002F65974|nr:hypothetical protein [Xanthomonas oryzae]QIF23180.1 hypothetical protein G6N84_14750 [Xanthomonas oryzae pv. oryzae]QQD51207.1 hypothetical protein BXO512_010755 [Xanthomonas oryzae pv. oryzae]UAD91223.1 hypothetical protein H9N23_18095 [Xanthomonas oryzae pv. oryzae]UEG97518.1 hypothetical protein LLC55_00225 [Xanthomonas oryzae pv. oryzae]UEQ25019.1 hypothetical protein LNP58_08910 [Xanthomonas oryzae pv. oryzae]
MLARFFYLGRQRVQSMDEDAACLAWSAAISIAFRTTHARSLRANLSQRAD